MVKTMGDNDNQNHGGKECKGSGSSGEGSTSKSILKHAYEWLTHTARGILPIFRFTAHLSTLGGQDICMAQ